MAQEHAAKQSQVFRTDDIPVGKNQLGQEVFLYHVTRPTPLHEALGLTEECEVSLRLSREQARVLEAFCSDPDLSLNDAIRQHSQTQVRSHPTRRYERPLSDLGLPKGDAIRSHKHTSHRKQIASLRRSGMRPSEIAMQQGRHNYDVDYLLRREGLTEKHDSSQFLDTVFQQYVVEGKTIDDIVGSAVDKYTGKPLSRRTINHLIETGQLLNAVCEKRPSIGAAYAAIEPFGRKNGGVMFMDFKGHVLSFDDLCDRFSDSYAAAFSLLYLHRKEPAFLDKNNPHDSRWVIVKNPHRLQEWITALKKAGKSTRTPIESQALERLQTVRDKFEEAVRAYLKAKYDTSEGPINIDVVAKIIVQRLLTRKTDPTDEKSQ